MYTQGTRKVAGTTKTYLDTFKRGYLRYTNVGNLQHNTNGFIINFIDAIVTAFVWLLDKLLGAWKVDETIIF